MPYSTSEPPIWPGPEPEHDRRGSRAQPNRAARAYLPPRQPTPRMQPMRPAPGPASPPRIPGSVRRGRGSRPAAVAVFLLISLLVVGGAALLVVHLRPTGPLGATSAMDTLSPQLAAYVAQQNGDMGVAVYDVTHNRTYTANADQTYILASSTKVYLMLADLTRIESAGRQPSDNDTQLLTAMIEHSNNDAAQTIYEQIGYASGMQQYLGSIGITDYAQCSDGWGCAKASPADMVHALTLLQQGKVLNAADRQLALGLMSQIEADQRMGVGETAPSSATYYMKDGWLNYPDVSLWNLNSSGIVVAGKETYIVSVYSQNQPGEDWTKVDHACALVAQALAG